MCVRLGQLVDAFSVGTDYDVWAGEDCIYCAFKSALRPMGQCYIGSTGKKFDDFEVDSLRVDAGTVVVMVHEV